MDAVVIAIVSGITSNAFAKSFLTHLVVARNRSFYHRLRYLYHLFVATFNLKVESSRMRHPPPTTTRIS